MNAHDPMPLADCVRELTEHHTHAEHYQLRKGQTWYGANHVTKVPPLIVQLLIGDVPSAAIEEGPRAGFASKPTARLDAIDTAVRIDLRASRWVKDLGEDDPGDKRDPKTGRYELGSGTIACVKLLHGLSASADRCTRRRPHRDPETRKITCCTWHQIDHDVRGWWTQARIVTGWDAPAWNPDNTCPVCGERGTLKIRLVEQLAMCTKDACRTPWDSETIGLLANHIREESSAERAPRRERGPCWCPVPKPIVPDLRRLCPRCGSARCIHALEDQLARLDTPSLSRGA